MALNTGFQEYFECSDEFGTDTELYGGCVTTNCGRFQTFLTENEVDKIQEIAEIIRRNYRRIYEGHSSTVFAELTSRKMTFGNNTLKMDPDRDVDQLLSELIDGVATDLRRIIKKKFGLGRNPLWLSR